ncbi:MAG: helix-turn-helix transcriptional regulator [Alphaproteobacteria bacterium]|nr:helix-turn-helix transcriptional regulator [Alphaproteobacteria bacterium]
MDNNYTEDKHFESFNHKMKNYFIGKNIADKRRERNLRADEVAKFLSISTQDLLLYESGEKEVDYMVLINLSKFFDVSIDSFFSYIENFVTN